MNKKSILIAVLSMIGLLAGLGCEGKKVTSLKLTPPGPYEFLKRVDSPQIKVTPLDQDGRPMPVLKATPTFESSDPKVVTVDAEGKLTAVGSGTAEIKIRMNQIEQAAKVTVSLAEVIEFTEDSTKEMRLSDDPGQVKVVVKDRLGNELKGRRVKFTTSDYCVKVRQNGTVFPASLGRCDVIATVDGATNAHTIAVRE
ncbi:MAG: hypothetical protein CMH56_16945 [Myxococcales bacterium]|nr:hypothetical protein [Myxococcales bacterium]|tara:strand:+ start:674 stop:1267 length:594 start_codon:yes stop_codon:yes gene_type:complete